MVPVDSFFRFSSQVTSSSPTALRWTTSHMEIVEPLGLSRFE